MASLASLEIPPPQNWQDFESLCCDLWRRIWKDPGAQMHGRGGQPQHGVDIFGRPDQAGEWAGVQCKGKGRLTGAKLTRMEIHEEVEKAKSFNPRLSSFVIATTAPRDAEAQAVARELTDGGAPFSVTVAPWEDIRGYLAEFPEVFAKHYPDFDRGGWDSTASVREQHLLSLWSRLYPLQLTGISGGTSERKDIPLAAVYTALDVVEQISTRITLGEKAPSALQVGKLPLDGSGDYLESLRRRVSEEAEATKERSGHEGYIRHLTAIEAAAALTRLVLLGPAGSGKSTFVRYLALSLAGEALGKGDANLRLLSNLGSGGPIPEDLAWPHRGLLPFFVELKKLVRSDAFRVEDAADVVLAYLREQAPEPSEGFGQFLQRAFAEEGARTLVVLDGLDETPAAETSRKRLCAVVAAFVDRCPRSRVLLTCRPYAYEPGSAWRLDGKGFAATSLAEFDRPKIRAFVDAWYRHLAGRGQVDTERTARRSERLAKTIEATPYLQPLARRPLMLTMMADLHATAGGRLPGGRAALYERSVELLLDRWNELRELRDSESVSDDLGMTVEQIRHALEHLAYRVHGARGSKAGAEPAEIPSRELWESINAYRDPPGKRRVDELEVRDYLHQRSGILVAESPETYRFPHRSYQEYMAACYLVRARFPSLLLEEVRTDPVLWREVTSLSVGKVSATPFTAWALLEGLVPAPPPAAVEGEDPRFLHALYAALAIRENGLWQNVQQQDGGKLERVRQWLQRSLEVGALSPVDRAEAGRVLALLGDRRRGVGLTEEGLPDIDWVEIPPGRFLMGSTEELARYDDEKPRHEVELAGFRISRYPVSHAQYEAFVADGGYTPKWKRCWTRSGWEWKGDRKRPEEVPDEYRSANQPRVMVTWYEAFAYCRWLGERLGQKVRLPAEAEWERAARGAVGGEYPWGDEWDAGRCNVGETGIGTTCAVGSFPSGASSEGVLDLSGNVWEWCSTRWRKNHEGSANDDPEGEASRVLRGGSFAGGSIRARCACRRSGGPRIADISNGFRVSAPI
jgi:formylglycine-generating enzyme required for sulfatase activity